MKAIRIRLLGLALVAGLFATLCGRVDAANLDKALLDDGAKLLELLGAAKVKSVGVLPFRVTRGTRATGYDAPLATSLPTRLENVLILRQGDTEGRNSIRVVRNAAATAGRGKVGPWAKNAEAFAKLFTLSYEPAWGSGTVMPQAFLTGEAVSTGDLAKVKVVVEVLTPDSFKTGKLRPAGSLTLSVKTDRSLLRDLGYNFASRAMVRKGDKSKASPDDLDQEAVKVVKKDEDGEGDVVPKKQDKGDDDVVPKKQAPKKQAPKKAQPGSHTPQDVAGLKLEIEYDGVKQEITATVGEQDGSKQPEYRVKAAKPGQKVVMYLSRVSGEGPTLGAVLKINGKSTFEEQEKESGLCRKWIYAPSKTKRDDFEGFYSLDESGKLSVKRWKVLTDDEANVRAAMLGGRVGWIDLDVFVSRETVQPADNELLITTRSVVKKRPATLREARARLAAANRMKVKQPVDGGIRARTPSGVIVGEVEPQPAGTASRAALPNPVRIGGISIRYVDSDGGEAGNDDK